MRRPPLVALAVVALSALAVVVVACSDPSSCKPGTVSLQILLSGTSTLADTLVVSSDDSFATLMESFPHTPGDASAAVLDVTFPNGYPKDMVVHLTVRALGGQTVLGTNQATVHLDPSCSSAHVSIFGDLLRDAAPTTD